MAVHGTGVIAGVSQTALQSQQLGRLRDKRSREAKRTAQRQQEIERVRMQGLEEDDGAEQATRIRIDSQIPEHEHHEHPEQRRRKREDVQDLHKDLQKERQQHRQQAADPEHATTYGPAPAKASAPPTPAPESPTDPATSGEAAPEPADDEDAPEPASHVAATYQHVNERPQHRLDIEG